MNDRPASLLKRNLIANYFGQGWVALMGLAFVPLYIRYLGIEAYGLIGLFALLTAWLSLLDMGMTPMLSREMARFTGGDHTAQSIRDLLRSIEIIVFGIAALIATCLLLASGWIAGSWLKTQSLDVGVVARALSVMGCIAALRFVESIYRSSILGLQRQVLFNVVNSSLATVRGVGAVAVLAWVSPTIQAFFLWQGIVSVATLALLVFITYRSLPPAGRPPRFSLAALRSVWRFAGGMLGITFLALLLTQVDKILLSRLLSLSDYGHYTLAAVVASTVFLMVAPITQAFYPRLCELYASGDTAAFTEKYHMGAQLVSVIAGSPAIVIILFSEDFLRLWTQDTELAGRVAPLLSLLMIGNLLNSMMHIPYQTQLAHGWTSLAVRINIVAVCIIIPAIIWATPRYGAEGAAWVWMTLNAGYLLFGVYFMYRRILTEEKWRWYLYDLLLPLGAGIATALAMKAVWTESRSVAADFSMLGLSMLLALCASVLAAVQVRRQLLEIVKPRFA